jgi:hypothetical protein
MTDLCMVIRPASLGQRPEEGRVEVGSEVADLAAEIHDDGQGQASQDGRVLLYVAERRQAGRHGEAPGGGPHERVPSAACTCSTRTAVTMLSFLICARSSSRGHHAALVGQAPRDLIGIPRFSLLEYADFIWQTRDEMYA